MADEPRPDPTIIAPQPDDRSPGRSGPDAVPPIGRGGEPARIAPRSARARLEPERVPQPARPSRRARHPVVIAGNAVFTTILILAIAVGLALAVGKQRFEAPGPLQADKIVIIPKSGLREVAELLEREGVIEHPWTFIAGVFALKARDDIKAGEYLFPKQASLRDVLDTMVEGKVVQHALTIPEGLTSEQIVARLLENPILAGPVREIPPEGTLLPETYKFTRGTTREQMIQRMQQAQRRVVTEAWERRSPDLPLKSPDQLVVMASIVEKETGKPEERSRVAAVFMNRLRQRMKLQSDPTIIYGLVGGKGSLGRPLMRSEIEQPTPYNTYVISGLPPGPIANPGRASIEATANPSRTKDLYFVADGTGGHAFSESLEQHQRNVARLRQLEQQAREGAKPAAEAAPMPGAAAAAPLDQPAGATAPAPANGSSAPPMPTTGVKPPPRPGRASRP
ncbi:MAG TPA: endolytic transglycosylase MltG [Xanthobacteraceae bacterium]|nr:endolytic transglycosylase MltG [Xanthobacteraceae bacterium]